LLFTKGRKKASMKQTDLSDMLRILYWSVGTSNVVVSHDPLSPTPSISSTMKTPKNTEEDPNVPEPAEEGDIQMECYSN
jgi:hypothetical protein